jgi:beta-phosphoglucomutase-like phosphatase (HAD superfamily)
MTKGVIALDADGVLLNYHVAYAKAWESAFGEKPKMKDPLAY